MIPDPRRDGRTYQSSDKGFEEAVIPDPKTVMGGKVGIKYSIYTESSHFCVFMLQLRT